jgi:KaiC/GvpD/RAD55 family RecA-like ATPase
MTHINHRRLTSGVPGLDKLLGGGFLHGSLVVIAGATGIGKTQLGMHCLAGGLAEEGVRGAILDLSSRGDAQHHEPYAERIGEWHPQLVGPNEVALEPVRLLDRDWPWPDGLQLWEYDGRPLVEAWQQADDRDSLVRDWNRVLERLTAFLYGHRVRGAKRLLIDGIEPVENPAQSAQWRMIEYAYQRVWRRDPSWVARELFRQRFREHEPLVESRPYEAGDGVTLVLVTTTCALLSDLISRPLADGDLAAGATTLIYLGRVPEGNQMRRGLYVAKHRGSACSDQLHELRIGDRGLSVS